MEQKILTHKKKTYLFRWFLKIMEKRLPIYLLAIVVSTAGLSFSNIANAWIVEKIVTVAQTGETEGLLFDVGITFLIFVLALLTWRVGIMHYNIEAKRGIAKLEKKVFSKAMRLPMSYYEEHHSGDFMSKLNFDTEKAGDIFGSRLRRFVDSILSAVILLIPMFYYSWQLTLCLLAVSFLSFVVNSAFIKPMKSKGAKRSKENAIMMEKLTDILAGMELAKMFPVGKVLLREYGDANASCYVTDKESNKLSAALESLNCLFDLLGALAFLGLGVIFISYDMIGLGQLTAIYTIYGTFRYVFLNIGRYLPQIMNCLANVERLYEFLEIEEEPEQYEAFRTEDSEDYAVLLEHVSFSYGQERKVLEDFSMKIPKDKCVALVGESGCGKSTIAKLLLGFYQPRSGEIYIGGQNSTGNDIKKIRDMIGYVPQEPYLYEVSIAENIAYGKNAVNPKEVPIEEIIRAAKIANAHDFIMQLPEGYDTIPGERGNKLSGGEKQRIAIARAVLKDAPILLLDEATSALDNESERLVNEAINRLCKERTTIMIAHRQSTIAMADEVIVVG